MNLKLILQETGQSWTLEPTRDYLVGSDRTCDIDLSQYPDVASGHLRLSCDRLFISNHNSGLMWFVNHSNSLVSAHLINYLIVRILIAGVKGFVD